MGDSALDVKSMIKLTPKWLIEYMNDYLYSLQ